MAPRQIMTAIADSHPAGPKTRAAWRTIVAEIKAKGMEVPSDFAKLLDVLTESQIIALTAARVEDTAARAASSVKNSRGWG